MTLSRRQALAMALFGTVAAARPALARATALGGFGLEATALGLKPGSPDDQSKALGAALAEAAKRGLPLLLPPGRYRIGGVALPDGARLAGVPGATLLVAVQAGPLLTARKARRIALSGLSFDGLGLRRSDQGALVALDEVADASLDDLDFANGGAVGLSLGRTGGRIERSRFARMRDTALFALDSAGLTIQGNSIEECGNNGLRVWRSSHGEDGTIIRGNRISRIRSDDGGNGPNGNGISLYRAGGVIAEGNVLRDCALTFIRNNGGSGVQILGNSGQRCGEVGIFSEFAFEGAIVSANRLEDVAHGISITNLDHGGRLATVSGNLIRRARRGLAPWGKETIGGLGIHVEAETAVTGNVVEDAESTGIALGWAWAMRNLAATGNIIRNAEIGIGVSLVPKERNVVVSGNVIAGARLGAVVGTEYGKPVTGDLTRAPDRRATGVRVDGNTAD